MVGSSFSVESNYVPRNLDRTPISGGGDHRTGPDSGVFPCGVGHVECTPEQDDPRGPLGRSGWGWWTFQSLVSPPLLLFARSCRGILKRKGRHLTHQPKLQQTGEGSDSETTRASRNETMKRDLRDVAFPTRRALETG